MIDRGRENEEGRTHTPAPFPHREPAPSHRETARGRSDVWSTSLTSFPHIGRGIPRSDSAFRGVQA